MYTRIELFQQNVDFVGCWVFVCTGHWGWGIDLILIGKG